MNYRNSEMRIDQLVSYLDEGKLNLSPVFQRGRVWDLNTRRKLLKNMVAGKPIPTIFLYKEESGAKYSYNILDGKQRLESLILFVGNKRRDLKITRWADYFFGQQNRKDAHFSIDFDGQEISIDALGDEAVREFREYRIPTVEITLEDDTNLDEIITL